MAKKYNLERLMIGRETAEMPAVDVQGPSREQMAETGDLFRERGTEHDDGRLDRMLGIDKSNEKVITVSLADTRSFGGEYGKHRFRTNEEKVEELAESIRQVGILNPLIVRPDPKGQAAYEVLAGMTRRLAAKKAGLERVPVIVRECDDEDAELIMAASNHQREDLLPSEKGWLYRIEYEAMKRKAGRQSNDEKNGSKVGNNLSRQKSIEELADKSEDSKNQILRYIRITYLIEPLAALTDMGKIPFVAAVDLSYLSEQEQEHVHGVIFGDDVKITAEIAAVLKDTSQNDHELTVTDVHNICKELTGAKVKPDKKYAVPEMLFPEEVKKKERADYVIRALRYIRENGIEV